MKKFNKFYLAVFFILAIAPNQYAFAEQKTLFCAESIEYNKATGQDLCASLCKDKAPGGCLESQLNDGWKVDAVSPKQVPKISDYEALKCVCIGQQYILSKNDEKAIDPSAASAKELELLKKENELLKKEVSMLKNDLNELKKKR